MTAVNNSDLKVQAKIVITTRAKTNFPTIVDAFRSLGGFTEENYDINMPTLKPNQRALEWCVNMVNSGDRARRRCYYRFGEIPALSMNSFSGGEDAQIMKDNGNRKLTD